MPLTGRAGPRQVGRLVDELCGVIGSRRLAPGQKLADAVLDVLVYGQDIAVPLGRRRAMPLAPARSSVEHLWRIGFPIHARRRLRGFRLRPTTSSRRF